ncbi:uncharacterized protein [Coffea arabica]|uniref:Integrase catalytic domain-containing protein n=1 Tax=Coffea arabica TaxID=13443 RepID=A0ABM4W253_COFAR
MPTGRLAKWQMILSEFDIVFTSQKAVKGQAIADHLAENPKDDDYQPLHTYFPDEKVLFVGAVEDMSEQCPEWRLFFDGAANSFGVGIGAVLVSLEGKHYPGAAKLQFACTNNMAEYEACIFGFKMALEMEVKELIAFSDSDLLVHQTLKQWVTKDSKILPYHYFVRRCIKCQMHGDIIRAPPTELHSMIAPWPCSMWGMDVIGTIDPPASNGHRFILVAIEYFTKWVEAESFKHVTKKVVANFLRDHIICRFGVPETLITDNAKNLDNDVVYGLCEQFKIRHRNSAIYRQQMNGAMEAANKNLKKIIRKMTEKHRDWHEKLPYALMAYRTSIRTSTGATPYSLMYGMEAVLPAEVEIPSLRILMETKLEEADWIKQRYEQLSLIDEKRLHAICHGQCYQKRMARAYNKKVHLRTFEEGDKVLKRILPVQDEAKGSSLINWQVMSTMPLLKLIREAHFTDASDLQLTLLSRSWSRFSFVL